MRLQRGQFIFVTRICEQQGINLIDLSNRIKVDKTTTTKVIQKLAEEGYVRRERDDTDKRAWRLYPTETALQIYPSIIQDENQCIDACFSGFSQKEREHAHHLLKRMRENIEQDWKAQKIAKEEETVETMAIKEYSPEYQDDVIDLILDIQQNEFSIPIQKEDQPDLSDIPNFYQRGKGNFWIATVDQQVVGTISLLDIGDNRGALRKLFVKPAYRGSCYSTAKRLLLQLIEWSEGNKIEEIYLGTTAKFLAAHRFYEKNSFSEIVKEELPSAFPIMKVDSKFYKYLLSHKR